VFLAALTLAVTLPRVVRVVSAHHGVCPASSNRIYSERTAKLFSMPLTYRPYRGRDHSESEILHNAWGSDFGNMVFITFDKARAVRFGRYPGVMYVRTFGVSWSDHSRLATLYFGSSGFYGANAARSDLRQLWLSECPTR